MQQNPKDQSQQNRNPQQQQGGQDRDRDQKQGDQKQQGGPTAISRAGASASTASKATSRAGCIATSSKAG